MSDHDPDLVARSNKTMSSIRTMIRIVLLSAIIGLSWLLRRVGE